MRNIKLLLVILLSLTVTGTSGQCTFNATRTGSCEPEYYGSFTFDLPNTGCGGNYNVIITNVTGPAGGAGSVLSGTFNGNGGQISGNFSLFPLNNNPNCQPVSVTLQAIYDDDICLNVDPSCTIASTPPPCNAQPDCYGGSFSVEQGQSINIYTNDVAFDPDGGYLSFSNVIATCGSVVNNGNFFTFTPPIAGCQNATILYTVCDQGGYCNAQPLCTPGGFCNISIDIIPVNHDPMPHDDTLTLCSNDTLPHTINVIANDSDIDPGQSLTISYISGAPSLGTIVSYNTTSITYKSNYVIAANDTVRYIVCDDGNPIKCAEGKLIVRKINCDTADCCEVPQIGASVKSAQCPASLLLSTAQVQNYSYQWFRDGVLIAGAQSSTYNATQNGNYTVRISKPGCQANSTSPAYTVKLRPIVNVNVNGNSVIISASGGSGVGYTYSLNNDDYQFGATFSGLTPGTYRGFAKDSNGCIGFIDFTIN